MTSVPPAPTRRCPPAGPVPPGAARGRRRRSAERWFEDGPAPTWPGGAVVPTGRSGPSRPTARVRRPYRAGSRTAAPRSRGPRRGRAGRPLAARHEAGAVAMEITLVAGRAEGEARSWYPEGALARRWVLIDGFAEGTSETFLPDGARFSVESLRRGSVTGARAVAARAAGPRGMGRWGRHPPTGPGPGRGTQAEGLRGGARHGPWRSTTGAALSSEGRFGRSPGRGLAPRSDAGYRPSRPPRCRPSRNPTRSPSRRSR